MLTPRLAVAFLRLAPPTVSGEIFDQYYARGLEGNSSEFPVTTRNNLGMRAELADTHKPERKEIWIGSRVYKEYIHQRSQTGLSVWKQRKNWVFGFYLGVGDERLWVPKRLRNGNPSADHRVLNLRHPLARGAMGILVLGYCIAVAGLAVLTAWATGSRW